MNNLWLKLIDSNKLHLSVPLSIRAKIHSSNTRTSDIIQQQSLIDIQNSRKRMMTDTNIDTIDEEKGFDRFNDSDADIPKEEGPKSSVSLNQDYISASNNILLSTISIKFTIACLIGMWLLSVPVNIFENALKTVRNKHNPIYLRDKKHLRAVKQC